MQTKKIKQGITRSLVIFIMAVSIGFSSGAQLQTDSSVQPNRFKAESAADKLPSSTKQSVSLNVTVDQPNTHELKFVVWVNNPERKKLSISISQKNLGILYSKFITSESYGATYNLGDLDDGEYSIEVASGTERIVKGITINTVVEVNRIAKINPEKNLEKKRALAF